MVGAPTQRGPFQDVRDRASFSRAVEVGELRNGSRRAGGGGDLECRRGAMTFDKESVVYLTIMSRVSSTIRDPQAYVKLFFDVQLNEARASLRCAYGLPFLLIYPNTLDERLRVYRTLTTNRTSNRDFYPVFFTAQDILVSPQMKSLQ